MPATLSHSSTFQQGVSGLIAIRYSVSRFWPFVVRYPVMFESDNNKLTLFPDLGVGSGMVCVEDHIQ